MLYAQVTAVPVYLPDLRLSIAVGIEGFSESHWTTSLQNMELKVMQNVKFNTAFGNPSKSFCHTFKCIQDIKLHFCNTCTFICVIYKSELQIKCFTSFNRRCCVLFGNQRTNGFRFHVPDTRGVLQHG